MNDKLGINRIRSNLSMDFVLLCKIRDRGNPELQNIIEHIGAAVFELNNFLNEDKLKYICTEESCEYYISHKRCCKLHLDMGDCALIKTEIEEFQHD